LIIQLSPEQKRIVGAIPDWHNYQCLSQKCGRRLYGKKTAVGPP